MFIWQIAPKIDQEFRNRFPEIHQLILQLLWNRGLRTQEEIDEFLLPDYSNDLHNPFLFKDMEKVVERIKKAVVEGEKITIYGDYDTDGVCATAILYLTLEKIGANVSYYLPDREKEGYGLNKEAIKKIIQTGTKLIITVDCGITNFEEIDFINKLGAKIIVTDHHLPLDNLPQALFIINPWVKDEKYPFKYLSGTGVAFKLIQALLKRIEFPNSEAFEKWLLDLVAIGSVADNVPLIGENRTLVKYGLIVLNKTPRPGLRHLIKIAGINLGELDTRAIGFQIASRLNAAGRVDHASLALEMILTKEIKKAEGLAERLHRFNESRQKKMEMTFNDIKKKVGQSPLDKIIIAYKENLPIGLLGLISHRLTETYNRPSILITIGDDEIKGVGRSINEFNLIEAFKKIDRFFLRYGGHAKAAGFTLKEKNINLLKEFIEEIKKIADVQLKDLDIRPKILIDSEVNLEEITWPLYEEIKKFEPFGEKNPVPIFLARNLIIEAIENVGRNNQHLKIIINGGRKMIYFGIGNKFNYLKRGEKIDVVFQLGETQWDGLKELEFRILDLKKSE
ncbi:MAG: single-stranded-DNA-specific exonuclease RecJ [Patescibacteria group bacterium]